MGDELAFAEGEYPVNRGNCSPSPESCAPSPPDPLDPSGEASLAQYPSHHSGGEGEKARGYVRAPRLPLSPAERVLGEGVGG